MGKRKEYFKITCTCDASLYHVIAIAEKDKLEMYKTKCLRAIVDFVDITRQSYKIDVNVEETKELPESGTDVFIIPNDYKEEEHKDDIDVISL